MSSSPTKSHLTEVVMPQLGVSLTEGTITSWRKRVGDWVERDEPILEISTDKVESEVPSPGAGRVAELLAEEGDTVEVGVLIAYLDTGAKPGEPHVDEGDDPGATEAPAAAAEPAAAKAPARTTNGNGLTPTSPVVRRIADEHGVDLDQIEGTGRRGRVTKKDLLAFIESGAQAAPAAKPQRALHSESPYVEEPVPQPGSAAAAATPSGGEMSVMRRRIAEHMVRSIQTAAHCTTVTEADLSGVERKRKAGPVKLSPLAFVARATVDALREHPQLNATLEGDSLTQYDEVHLGIAVSLGEEGLVVPVIRNAHELSPEGLGAKIKDIATRAREKKLAPGETSGGTFTITNPGPFGTLISTPIINQPQVGILDLEAVVKRPVVVTDDAGMDSIAIRPMSYLCLSWDHRAIDGVRAAQFLASLKANLERWRDA